jgi:hypothetical protein
VSIDELMVSYEILDKRLQATLAEGSGANYEAWARRCVALAYSRLMLRNEIVTRMASVPLD